MRGIVADLDGRRREIFEQAQVRLKELAELVRQRREERRAKGESSEAPAMGWAR